MARIAIVLIGFLYTTAGFATVQSCLQQQFAGTIKTNAELTTCLKQRPTASANTTSTSSTSTSGNNTTATTTASASTGASTTQGLLAGGLNSNNLFQLIILSQWFPQLKQYLEYALLQQYPQLYWLSFFYGGSALDAFKAIYGFDQPVYALANSSSSTANSPAVNALVGPIPGVNYNTNSSQYVQQYLFANFLRQAFFNPAATTSSTAGK